MRLGNGDHFLQRGEVAEHGIDAFKDDQLAGFPGQSSQPFFKRLYIVMPEGDDLGVATPLPALTEADEATTGPASFMAVDPDGNTILVDQHV